MDATEFADLPPSQFDETWARLSSNDRVTLAKDLSVLAQGVAFAARYADMRDCGQSHKAAIKLAEQTLARLRRALGYTYPKAIY